MKIKKAKSSKKCGIKINIKFEDYKKYLEAAKIQNRRS